MLPVLVAKRKRPRTSCFRNRNTSSLPLEKSRSRWLFGYWLSSTWSHSMFCLQHLLVGLVSPDRKWCVLFLQTFPHHGVSIFKGVRKTRTRQLESSVMRKKPRLDFSGKLTNEFTVSGERAMSDACLLFLRGETPATEIANSRLLCQRHLRRYLWQVSLINRSPFPC